MTIELCLKKFSLRLNNRQRLKLLLSPSLLLKRDPLKIMQWNFSQLGASAKKEATGVSFLSSCRKSDSSVLKSAMGLKEPSMMHWQDAFWMKPFFHDFEKETSAKVLLQEP